MNPPEYEFNVATLNIQGQTSLTLAKQQQIEDFIKLHNIHILHLQEIEISSNTFEKCKFISANFNIIQNNSPFNKYDTASLMTVM